MHKTAFTAESVNKLPQLSTFKAQAEKVTGCVVIDRDFDVRTLPRMAEALERPAKEAQALSEALGKTFWGQPSRLSV